LVNFLNNEPIKLSYFKLNLLMEVGLPDLEYKFLSTPQIRREFVEKNSLAHGSAYLPVGRPSAYFIHRLILFRDLKRDSQGYSKNFLRQLADCNF
jgi:hypothetical protein